MHQTLVVLNGAFRWAKRNRRVRNNPVSELELPNSTQAPREVIPPDVATVVELVGAALQTEPVFGAACRLGATTGMRHGELAGLRWSRIDLVGGRVQVESTVNDAGGMIVVDDFTKTRRGRSVR